MKLLVATGLAPHAAHSERAANIVIFEMVRALAAQEGVRVGLLVALRSGDPQPSEDDRAGAAALRELGVDVLEPIRFSPPRSKRSTAAKLLAPRPEDFYPERAERRIVHAAVARWRADVVLVPWTEWLTAVCADAPATLFAYYGNPDPKAARHRAEFKRRNGGDAWTYLRERAYCRVLEGQHLGLMRRYACLGDVAANDAAWYAARGHPNAFYIQNIWIDRFGMKGGSARSARRADGPIKIIANVGKLDGTANSYGLMYLCRELLPELRRALAGRAFELHVLGAREPHPAVARALEAPEVLRRGFVADIDAEILDATLFLCANNATPYNVGHTRYLHAWTLGACVLGHQGAHEAMPEIEHRKNALLGRDAAEIAALAAEAAADPALRKQMGEAGYETYRAHFRAERVAERIVQRLAPAVR